MIDTTRYNRQLLLPHFDIEAQQKLALSSVLVVGAGGLGCPVLNYLTIAGVGHIICIDADVVSFSNLHRQWLYTEADIGKPKAKTAVERLAQQNTAVQLDYLIATLNSQNALEIIKNVMLVIDCTDNFATRYLINDTCLALNKPFIHGAVYEFQGQMAVLNYGKNPITYRDLFPIEEVQHKIIGVMGIIPGIIGTLQATEAIKILSGIGTVLENTLLFYNALENDFKKFTFNATL